MDNGTMNTLNNWKLTKETNFYKYYEYRLKDEKNSIYYHRDNKFLGKLKQMFINFVFKTERTPLRYLYPYGRWDFTHLFFKIRDYGTK